MTAAPIDTVRDKLEANDCRPKRGDGNNFTALCPAHEDHNPSLSVSVGRDHPVVVKCHAGCTSQQILGALGLDWQDVCKPKDPADFVAPATTLPTPPATYTYVDETGAALFRVHRRPDKQFPQQAATGDGGWRWGMDGVRRVLYRLPQVIQAVEAGRWVFIVEGEKDADRLASLGLTATTSPGGAGNWRRDYADVLAGAHVAVIPDNDQAGYDHATDITRSLDGVAAEIRVVMLPGVPPKGDVSDWLDGGRTRADLEQLVASAPGVDALEQTLPEHGPSEGTSWEAVDDGPYLDGTYTPPVPTQLVRDDGLGLFYPGETNGVFGESESGKSWLVLYAAVQALHRGEAVIYVDFEDTPARIYHRMRLLGATVDQLHQRFRYVQPDQPLDDAGHAALMALVDDVEPSLVVFDGVTDALGLHGLDPNSNADYRTFDHLLPRPVADRGPAVVTLDHVPRSKDADGKYAIGAQHKRAAVRGASIRVEVVRPLAPGRVGTLRLTIAKDRPGALRAVDVKHAGEFELDATDPDDLAAVLRAPEKADPDQPFRPTFLMERVSRVLEDADGLSVRGVMDAVEGRRDAVKLALDRLVEEGFVARETGARNALIHRSEKPFREADPTVPDPSTVPHDRSRVPDRSPDPRERSGAQSTSDRSRVPDPPLRSRGVGERSGSEANGHGPDPICTVCGDAATAVDVDGTDRCRDHTSWSEVTA